MEDDGFPRPPKAVCLPCAKWGVRVFGPQNDVKRTRNEVNTKNAMKYNENEHPEMFQIMQREPQENLIKHREFSYFGKKRPAKRDSGIGLRPARPIDEVGRLSRALVTAGQFLVLDFRLYSARP